MRALSSVSCSSGADKRRERRSAKKAPSSKAPAASAPMTSACPAVAVWKSASGASVQTQFVSRVPGQCANQLHAPPSCTVCHSPANDGDYSPLAFSGQVAIRRHLSGANYLFADGHAQLLIWSLVRSQLTPTGSRFVNPAGNP